MVWENLEDEEFQSDVLLGQGTVTLPWKKALPCWQGEDPPRAEGWLGER